ncbi:MAG: YigZ family protein [Lachnospiraceae bacterium]
MPCKIVYQGGNAEIVEKKSRFLASVQPVNSEEEALEFLQEVRREHWGAKHHCYAYVIGEGQRLQRFSDDGEPAGTAGKPILEVLLAEDVHNTLIVVTRYFGGILLGTGGLVRAYTKAAAEGLQASRIAVKQWGCRLKLRTDYAGAGKVQYLLGKNHIPVTGSEFTESVQFEVLVTAEEREALESDLTEATNGQIQIVCAEQLQFALADGEILEFQTDKEA